MTYLDNAATSLKKPFCVYSSIMYNTVFNSVNAGRSAYKKSIDAIKIMTETAEETASFLNANDGGNIAFMPNATLGLNMLINGIENKHIVITGTEHNSVLRPVYKLGNYTVVGADNEGYVNPEGIRRAIREDTTLIICNHCSNVTGSIQPIEKIGLIAKEYKIPFLVDASQSMGVVPIDVRKMNIDMLAFSGHKGLMGPLGSGGIYISEDININPIITGGTGSMSESFLQPDIMPDKLQSGTQNIPAIAGLGAAVRFVHKRQNEIFQKEKYLAKMLKEDLMNIKDVEIYGGYDRPSNGTVAFNIKGMDCVSVGDALWKNFKIAVRTGLHCAPLMHESIGTKKIGAVRASFGYFNNEADEKKIVKAINNISKK